MLDQITLESWNDVVSLLPTYAVRMGVALVCGLILGMERERKDKPAGLRTIVLISLGSALFMIVGNLVPFAYQWTDLSRIDPSRIAANVVTGIGFLGAGTIIQSRGSVQGLTTAATIWVASGIGMCAGIGFNVLALGFTGLVLVALLAMDPIRVRLTHLGRTYEMEIVSPDDSLVLRRILYVLDGHDVSRDQIAISRIGEDEMRVAFVYRGSGGAALLLLESLARIDRVHGRKVGDDVDAHTL